MSISWSQTLIEAVARRRAVVLIGSGVSANAQNAAGQRPPTWGIFLSGAYKALGRRVRHIESALKHYRYLEACAYLRTEHGATWQDVIRGNFVSPRYEPARIHTAIFELDVRIVASLNFDKIYETYAIPASDNTLIIKNYYDEDVRQTVAGSDRYLIKPHGTVDTISKMIFTLEDYAKARTAHAPFYEMMTALLHTHTFLCIGCGLSDPDMQLIFEDYQYKHSESPHFITLPKPIADAESSLIRKTRGLNVLAYSPREQHKELTDSLFDLGAKASTKRDEIAISRNW